MSDNIQGVNSFSVNVSQQRNCRSVYDSRSVTDHVVPGSTLSVAQALTGAGELLRPVSSELDN